MLQKVFIIIHTEYKEVIENIVIKNAIETLRMYFLCEL